MIFPTEYTNQTSSMAEEKMHQALKALFGDSNEVDVFTNVRIQGKDENEIDFVVLSPKYICIIEVKGGIMSFDRSTNSWSQNSKYIKSPIRQAIENKHAFIKRFGSEFGFDIHVFWTIAFPDMKIDGALPAECLQINVIDGNKLAYLKEHFESIESAGYRYSDRKEFPHRGASRAIKKISGTLSRSFGFEPSIESTLHSNDAKFASLLSEQIAMIDALEGNKRVLIQGDAGTGKSLVGLHQLFRRHELGEKVLFLTFNRNLAKNFSRIVSREYSVNEDMLEIVNFHSFARRVIGEHDASWWDSNLKKEDFWDLLVPVRLDEVVGSMQGIYDFIVIDEGQDFEEIWLEPIFKLVGKEGKISILIDDKQDLYNRGSDFSNQGFVSFKLSKVIRSSKRNVSFVNDTLQLNLESHNRTPEGIGISDLRASRDKVSSFNDLLRKLGIKASRVIFIYDPEIGLGEFEGFSEGRDKMVKERSPYVRRGQIVAVSVKLMKGLECDIAAVVGIDKFTEESHKYVALTRARNGLVLI